MSFFIRTYLGNRSFMKFSCLCDYYEYPYHKESLIDEPGTSLVSGEVKNREKTVLYWKDPANEFWIPESPLYLFGNPGFIGQVLLDSPGKKEGEKSISPH